jgi:ribonucleotide reductase beta subunit family protein with ferritin-like domain
MWSRRAFVHEEEIAFNEVAKELKKLEYYERRAFSRMIKTLRALDQAKAECVQA